MNHRTSPIIHPWLVSVEKAKQIQHRFSEYVILKDDFDVINTVAGVGVVYSRNQDEVLVGCMRLSFPELRILQKTCSKRKATFSYAPGFFAFSAGPAILSALKKMERPDLIMFPGRGIAHPRGLGLASHLGILLDIPTIAVSKTPLWRDHPEPPSRKGAHVLMKGEGGKFVGAVMRTREGTRPIFVTPGHKISAQTAVKIVLDCCPKYRMPEPLRLAHAVAKNSTECI